MRHPRTETPLAIAVYGEWGTGKTSAMKWLEARLRDWNDHIAGDGAGDADTVKLVPVWFYPWKYQEREDVWRGLIAEIILATLGQNKAVETAKKQAEGLEFLGRGLKRLVSGVKLKFGPATLDLKDVFKDDGPDERPEADYLNEFESALKGWLKSNLGKNERMVVFIDDLDRCLPKVALQVLEALKLYLNLPRLVFVAGVDRTVILNLVRRSPREIKRVVNSALIAGEGIEMSSRNWAEGSEPTLAQGIQVELIRRILRDRFQRETLLGSETGNAFFQQWSGIVGANPDEDSICVIARADLDRLHGEGRDTATGAGRPEADPDEERVSATLANIPERWHAIAARPQFRPFLELLADIDLGNLMRVAFSAEAAEAQGEDISSDAQRIIDEAVARQSGKPVDEITDDDRKHVTILEINSPEFDDARSLAAFVNALSLSLTGSQVSDLSPLIALTKLKALYLAWTQVSDLGPLADLTDLEVLDLVGTRVHNLGPLSTLINLQYLDLTGTQVSDLGPLTTLAKLGTLELTETQVGEDQIAALQAALPSLEIIR